MTDIISKARRSWNMSQVHSKNTQPELIVRSILHNLGYRYRLHKKELPGKPDIVLIKYKTVVFVNGCFWHRHKNCHDASSPKSRIDFWEAKFSKNIERDKKNQFELKKMGWKILIVWECETSNIKSLQNRFMKKLIDT